jgi:hypothetical protein
MWLLFVKAYLKLIQFEYYLVRGNFPAIYETVRDCPISGKTPCRDAIENVCAAADLACIWFWREARCLQRSAATACLLRSCGVPADLVIGAKQMPFKAHAWVEVQGVVINDKPYMREIYAILEKC